MEQPTGRCDRCGERLYAQLAGGDRCYNCGREEATRASHDYRIQ